MKNIFDFLMAWEKISEVNQKEKSQKCSKISQWAQGGASQKGWCEKKEQQQPSPITLSSTSSFKFWKNARLLLQCLTPGEGTFGTHSSGHTMAKKILREGYFWSTMEADCYQHSQTCHKCQIYVDKVHVPLVPLNVLTAPWPFAMWGIDMIGEIRPTTSNGHRFILVAIDSFSTTWSVTKNIVARFI